MITTAFQARLTAFLAPLFATATSDLESARKIALETLLSYDARTDRELRLAALNIAFSISALDAMSRAADPTLPLNQVIRLRANANALNRSAIQSEIRFNALRTQHAESMAPDREPTMPTTETAKDLIHFAKSHMKPEMAPAPPAPMSRQQRRAAERQAAKAQRRKAELDRRAQRAAAMKATRHNAAHVA